MNSFISIKDLATSFLNQAMSQLPKIATAIVLFFIFYIAAHISAWLIQKTIKRLHWNKSVKLLLSKCTKVIIIILGLVTALGTAGVNISALVASLGLTSFAIGFAFRDLLTNTLAGVLILIYQPFKIGQTITGKDFDGQVIEINLRYIKLVSKELEILVPNSTMLTNVVNVHGSNTSE